VIHPLVQVAACVSLLDAVNAAVVVRWPSLLGTACYHLVGLSLSRLVKDLEAQAVRSAFAPRMPVAVAQVVLFNLTQALHLAVIQERFLLHLLILQAQVRVQLALMLEPAAAGRVELFQYRQAAALRPPAAICTWQVGLARLAVG
jgi:hypothetical protein